MSTNTSILNRSATLGEITDQESLRELCDRFQENYDVGVAIFDANGKTVVPPAVPRTNPGLAQDYDAAVELYMAASPESRGQDVSSLQLHDTGARFLTLPISNDLDVVGVAIVGPFAHTKEEAADGGETPLPVLEASEAKRLGKFLRDMIDLLVFTSYKSFLTARVHVESMEDSFRELEEKNRELQESYEALKELDHMKSGFLSTVSHELRTPLTSIIGYSEMLADGLAGKLPAKAQRQVEIIVEKGELLLTLINNLLDLSKIESGRMEIAIDELSLPRVVDHALDTIRPQANKRSIALVTEMAQGLDRMRADKNKLRQILINLLSNAVKFTPDEGRVKLSAAHKNHDETPGIEISVSDNGIGIPEDQLEAVFDRFFQVDHSSTREFGGTGLGLPIVKSFVEMHGGFISAHRNPDAGTTMRFWIPEEPVPTIKNPFARD